MSTTPHIRVDVEDLAMELLLGLTDVKFEYEQFTLMLDRFAIENEDYAMYFRTNEQGKQVLRNLALCQTTLKILSRVVKQCKTVVECEMQTRRVIE